MNQWLNDYAFHTPFFVVALRPGQRTDFFNRRAHDFLPVGSGRSYQSGEDPAAPNSAGKVEARPFRDII